MGVALVSGGARGIGREVALSLASAGFDVAILDICAPVAGAAYALATSEDLEAACASIEALGRHCLPLVADVRDQAAVQAAVTRAVAELGGLEVVCAAAGIARDGPFWETTDDQWADVIGINLTGAWHLAKSAVPHLIERGTGSIIFVASTNGLRGVAGGAAYAASKHGVLGLMKSVALELGPHGIRANAVLPGWTRTPLVTGLRGDPEAAAEHERKAGNRTALRGVGMLPASAIADAVAWLASPQAAQVTGVELVVDAGHLLLPGYLE